MNTKDIKHAIIKIILNLFYSDPRTTDKELIKIKVNELVELLTYHSIETIKETLKSLQLAEEKEREVKKKLGDCVVPFKKKIIRQGYLF